MTEQWRGWLPRVLWAAAVLAAVGLTLVVGYVAPQRPSLALVAAGGVLLLGLSVSQPVVLPILAMPLVTVIARLSGGGIDMSISDWMIGLAFWPAVLLAPRPFSAPLRAILWLTAIYQALTLLTVVANPFLANTVEWFHAWMIVGGALIVGWAVGASGNAKLGMSLFLLAAAALAAVTVGQAMFQYANGDFSAVYPRWPWAMHKNFIGTLLAFAALATYLHPAWMGWSRRVGLSFFWLFAAGVTVSQSRQALIALGMALLVVSIRRRDRHRRSVLVLSAIGPALIFVGTLVRDQIEEGNRFNSWFQRLDWYGDSVTAWLQAPWLGHGLRYWTQPGAPTGFQPPQAFLEVLASAGVMGLAGFLVLMVGVLVVLWRVDPDYGTLGFAVVLTRLAQGQFDLFWVGGTTTIPFLVAGVCLGALWHAQQQGTPGMSAVAVDTRAGVRV